MKKRVLSVRSFLWRKKWLFLVIALVVGGGFFVAKKQRTPKDEAQFVHPQYQTITDKLEVSGSVDAYERADLHFPTVSRLSWVGVTEGDAVKKWQGIASVDTRTLQKQLEQDINAFVSKARDYTVNWDDYERSLHPDVVDTIRPLLDFQKYDLDRKDLYTLDTAALNVEITQIAIKLSSIVSPIEGLVTRIDTPNAGVTVSPTDIFQVVNPKTVYFGAVVDEVDIAKVKEGQQVTLILDAYPDQEIISTVTKVEFTPSTSRSGGTGYLVHMSLVQPSDLLQYKLGMSGTASILLSAKEHVLTVPTDSLIDRDGKTFVKVKRTETIEEVAVDIGLETDEFAEVESGLSEQDEVVLPKAGV